MITQAIRLPSGGCLDGTFVVAVTMSVCSGDVFVEVGAVAEAADDDLIADVESNIIKITQ